MNKKFLNYYFNLIYKKSNFHIFNIFLFVLSWIYYFCIISRELCYKNKVFKTKKFKDVFVISVGNLTTGGTGKTPVVMKYIEVLLGLNKKIAVISRGYNRKNNNEIKLVFPHSEDLHIEDLGDEPFMIANRYADIFLGVGQDRKEVIQRLLPEKIDVCILDDGYQKLSIARDLNMLIIDATNPFGNGFLFPRGILREPIKNISRADLIILTKTNLVDAAEIEFLLTKIKRLGYTKKIILSKYLPIYFYNFFTKEKLELDELKGKSVDILTGIGNPKSLEKIINSLGINIGNKNIFPDHYWYTKNDFDNLSDDFIITTEKDSVKLSKYRNIFGDKKIFALIMDVRFEEKDNFLSNKF